MSNNNPKQSDVKHGGWYGDSAGHAKAANIRWHANDAVQPGHGGWYGNSKGHSEAARLGWGNPDHGPSGWFGDEKEHSEVAHRGREGRSSD